MCPDPKKSLAVENMPRPQCKKIEIQQNGEISGNVYIKPVRNDGHIEKTD